MRHLRPESLRRNQPATRHRRTPGASIESRSQQPRPRRTGADPAKAFQEYGAYIANDADRSVNNIVTELSPSGSVAGVYDASGKQVDPGQFQTDWGVPFDILGVNGTDPWSQDIETIFAHLQIVTNNAAGGWTSGGGTPLAPFAPPL